MRIPVIPDTLAICATCNKALAMQGKQECCDCLLETRFAAWAMADGELPPGLRFIGNIAKTFEPVGYRPVADGGTIPVFEDPQFTVPRITEVPQPVPLPPSRAAEAAARRIAAWIGLLVLFAFASGWMFARFG